MNVQYNAQFGQQCHATLQASLGGRAVVSGATLHGVTVCRPLHTDALLSHERGEQLVVLVASISSTAQQSGCVHVLAAREFPAADIEKSMIAEAQRSSNNRACRRTPSHFGIAAPSGEIAPAIDLLCDAGVQISWADAGAAFVNRPVSAQANPAGHSRHHHNPGERPRALSSLTRQSLASREPLSGPLSRPSPTATATDPSPGDGAKALPSAARMAAQSPAQMRGKSKGAAAPPMFPGAKLRPEADGTGGQQQSATAAVHRGAAATLQQGFITAVGNSSVTATFGRGAFATDVEQSRVPPAWRQTGTTEEGGKRKEAFAAKVPLVPRKRRLHEGGAPPHADKADHAPEAIRIEEAHPAEHGAGAGAVVGSGDGRRGMTTAEEARAAVQKLVEDPSFRSLVEELSGVWEDAILEAAGVGKGWL